MIYDEVAKLIAGGGVREWALDVLGDIAAGRTGVTAVRHPLGFLCLPLERAGGDGVCVHVWSPQIKSARITTSPVHCHSWELLSYVLYGHVANVHVSVIDTAQDPTHRVFEVVSAPDKDVIRPIERTVRYETIREEWIGPGETYALDAGVFHMSIVSDGGEAATVALGREVPGHKNLSLGPLTTPLHHVTRERCDQEETARAAELVKRQLCARDR